MSEVWVKQRVSSLSSLRRPSPHFQRSINLKYDLGDADYIRGYIPTPNAAQALIALLAATRPESGQRAHLLYGAYGSGKSLFATVLAAIMSRDDSLQAALAPVLDRLEREFPDVAEVVAIQQEEGPRLLPVILSGDEGDLSLALGRALDRTLTDMGLDSIRPSTVYNAALETIRLWCDEYPTTYDELANWLKEQDKTRNELINGLESYQPWAYRLFLQAYPDLTAGASFYRHNGQSIVAAYQQTVCELHDYGYDGIVVLWDEFGRFLEVRAGEPSGKDAALLQDFAEACNRSEASQIHLILVAHKELGQYASHLPESYQKEWERIAGRFRQVDLSGNPEVSYRLIAEALDVVNSEAWAGFLEEQRATMSRLLGQIFDLGLFRLLTEDRIRELILEGAYPLHPLTAYCLPRLSNRVAQNERTLFTFLASEEPNSLGAHLVRAVPGEPEAWVRLDRLWDYFANAVRADVGAGGVHAVWTGVESALSKVLSDDDLSAQLVKSLGVLTIVGSANGLAPTTDLLCFAVGEEGAEGRRAVEDRLRHLVQRKTLILNQKEGVWEFFAGSSIDLEARLIEQRETRVLSPIQRRRLLERVLPPHHYRARGFNQEHGMTRFFWSLYRVPQELDGVDWELTLRKIRVNGQRWEYADGFIVYVLATDEAELNQASQLAKTLEHLQVLFVVPKRPLLIEQPLIDWLMLEELSNDARFKEQDPERIPRELAFYQRETEGQLEQALMPLMRPAARGADWYRIKPKLETEPGAEPELEPKPERMSSPPESDAQVTRLLSDICGKVFKRTPGLHNELLNKREPSAVQVRAANRVIDALLVEELAENLGLTGGGPDVMALKTVLNAPGILRQAESGQWEIGRPQREILAQAWDKIDRFLQRAQTEPRPFDELLHKLQSPPHGLRLGILPLLIASAMRGYLHVATVRKRKKAIIPLTSATFTDLCRHPDQYTVEVGVWGGRQEDVKRVLDKYFSRWVTTEDRRFQPLSYLSLGMLRWLQSQSRYARDTNLVSPEASRLRELIRRAGTDPTRVLFEELPALLAGGSIADIGVDYRALLEERLASLLNEISTVSEELLRRLDQFAAEHFAADSPTPLWHGRLALSYWLTGIEQQAEVQMNTLRFGDVRAEGLIDVVRAEEIGDAIFWEQLSQRLIGISLRDWNDQSEKTFKAQLLETKEWLERETLELTQESEIVELHIRVPEADGHAYRFRPADLSVQGQRILQNFKSTLQIAGRPLSPDERRQVALALLHYVLGEEDA